MSCLKMDNMLRNAIMKITSNKSVWYIQSIEDLIKQNF